MSKPIIRYLRFHCPTPTSMPQANRDGALAVAAIREDAPSRFACGIEVGVGQWNRRYRMMGFDMGSAFTTGSMFRPRGPASTRQPGSSRLWRSQSSKDSFSRIAARARVSATYRMLTSSCSTLSGRELRARPRRSA